MSVQQWGGLAGILLLTGCGVIRWSENKITPAPKLTYSAYSAHSSTDLDYNEVAFTLEASVITFNAPPDSKSGLQSCSGADWTACFSGVTATSTVAAPERKVFPASDYQTMFVARPVQTFRNQITTSYAISATPVANNELLLKQVAFTNQNNLDNIVKGAGAGAAAGFAFGPFGAVIGGMVGAAGGVGQPYNAHLQIPGLSLPPITPVVCAEDKTPTNQRYKYDDLYNLKQMALDLPFVITPGPSKNFMKETRDDDPKSCWHPIPNTLRPTVVETSAPGAAAPRKGDGWFYRIVDGNDFSDPETGLETVPVPNSTTLDGASISDGPHFPVSACHKIVVQVTWWQAISDFIANGKRPPIKAVTYDEEIADPGFINYITIPKSGSINFRLVCGAYASNSFAGPPLGTLMTDLSSQVAAVKKAQPAPSKSSGPGKSSTSPLKGNKG